MSRIIPSLAQIGGDYDVLFCDLWGCLHNGERPFPAAVAALQAFRAAGGRVVLNPAPVLALDPEVLRSADPLVVNEHEAAAVLEQLGGAGTETGADAEPQELVAALRDAGVRSVVLTLGARGAVVAGHAVDAGDGGEGDGGEADEPAVIPAAQVEVVDTTGAGDAFIGALAAHLASGEDLVRAAERATAFAGRSVTARGAQSSYPR